VTVPARIGAGSVLLSQSCCPMRITAAHPNRGPQHVFVVHGIVCRPIEPMRHMNNVWPSHVAGLGRHLLVRRPVFPDKFDGGFDVGAARRAKDD
jgi:hypothetical protein